MALVRCDYFSDVLGVSTSMTVILPQATSAQIGVSGSAEGAPRSSGAPTLYLLHGLSDDGTAWTRYTSLERYVEPLGLAVVMPEVGRSFYCDQAHGLRYWEHLSQEVPQVAQSFFRLSPHREDTFVAGLSMGGYGAVKWALQQPERFAAAASLSGALDLAGRQDRGDLAPDVQDATFGGRRVAGSDDDLLALLRGRAGRGRGGSLSEDAAVPPVYVCCGTEDRLVDDARTFTDVAREVGLEVTLDVGPGDHEWGYWDTTIRDVLAWLPLRR